MRIDLQGVTVGYDDRGRGRPLVLLHAFPFDRRMWTPVAEIVERTCRVITPDFRGLGESSGNMTTVDEAADDVARLLDRLKIDRAVIGGLSMGGYVALAFARRHPRQLAGLLLADTRATADTVEGRSAREAAIANVAGHGVRPFAEEYIPKLVVPQGDAKVRDLAMALALLQSPTGVASAIAALRDRPDATPDLTAIRAPTTVIVGTQDTLTPPSDARQLVAAIPGAQLVEIAGAGHLACLDNPERFAAAVEQLVARA